MDFESLQAFARAGDQQALAEVVRRHLDLVFGTALRKTGDAGAAEEIAQNVFAALARKAWQFAPEDSLPAWLHKTALLEAKAWWRGELRRRHREQTAAELGTTMRTSEAQPALRTLVPLLDEALLSLREKDRTALLLRFYESQSLREVGGALGVNEDTAQKRVAAALDRLSQFFQRRGFKTATVAAATAALQNTAVSASATTVNLVVNAALQTSPPAWAGLTALLARLASLTKAQTAALCVAVAAGPVGWELSQMHRGERAAADLRTKLEALNAREEQSSTDIQRLRTEVNRLEIARREASQAQERNAAAVQKIETLKQRIRGLLTVEDYRWPDDLPFARIPKSLLGQVDPFNRYLENGAVTPHMAELLALIPAESQAVQEKLVSFLDNISRLAASRAYETNTPVAPGMPRDATTTKTFLIPSLGEEGKALLNQLDADIGLTLGDRRALLLLEGLHKEVSFGGGWWESLWRKVGRLGEGQEITVGMSQQHSLVFRWGTKYYNIGPDALDQVPGPICQLFRPWLAEMGYTKAIPFYQ